MARISSFALRSSGDYGTNGNKADEEKKDLWSSMLDGVSSGKRLPQKTVFVLGGTPETQKEFLESLNTDQAKRRHNDRTKEPPVANQFALGYTYQDVLDADHEDILARLSVYLLNEPSPSFRPLATPLLTTEVLSNMLLVILLDWNEPWNWMRQLRDWVRFVRSLLLHLDDECKDTMEENITRWKNGGQAASADGAAGSTEDSAAIPLGPGEWDEPLGIPLCVVCQNADKIEAFEQERGWKDEDFDLVLQYLRTVLLKHGASLIYTMPSQPGSMPAMIHSWLGIQETSKLAALKHNVVDRDRVLIPPHWDSWGKIRLLREGFNIEEVSKFWSNDIRLPEEGFEDIDEELEEGRESAEVTDSVSMYELAIRNPTRDPLSIAGLGGQKSNWIEVDIMDNQEFLKQQQDALEKLRLEDEEAKKSNRDARQNGKTPAYNESASTLVTEHIGQVQFNMGGIQVDAEEMLTKINNREAERASETVSSPRLVETPSPPGGVGSPIETAENERLKNFFADLLKKPSTTGSPRS